MVWRSLSGWQIELVKGIRVTIVRAISLGPYLVFRIHRILKVAPIAVTLQCVSESFQRNFVNQLIGL